MQKIIPHLWYDKEAKEAADFYVSVFGGDSKAEIVRTLHNTPSGDVDVVSFTIWGYTFNAISAGPLFKFTPAISISVQCHSEAEINEHYKKLMEGGMALMALDAYPWSEKYAWVGDKYGLTWQLNLPKDQDAVQQRINPALMYVGPVAGKAQEAMDHYVSTFPNSGIEFVSQYEKGEGTEADEGSIKHAVFKLFGERLMALDSAYDHKFNFNEAVSLLVNCDTQEEIDTYWEKLSAIPESEQCGWLKDKFGVSWQIVPSDMEKMMREASPEQMNRVTEAFLKMKKFDLEALRKAYAGA